MLMTDWGLGLYDYWDEKGGYARAEPCIYNRIVGKRYKRKEKCEELWWGVSPWLTSYATQHGGCAIHFYHNLILFYYYIIVFFSGKRYTRENEGQHILLNYKRPKNATNGSRVMGRLK